MFDISKLYSLRENNQLEVKTAKGGLPNSIWETYSSFSNTHGGVILLGVAEKEDKTLYPAGLSELEVLDLQKKFWDTINNTNKVSLNTLTDKKVKMEQLDSSYILVIEVPEASRYEKPIYLNDNLLMTFRRNFEGDYKCTKIEIQGMLRDQESISNDSIVVKYLALSALNQDTIKKYRNNYQNSPTRETSHPFNADEDDIFLFHIGAAGYDENNNLHPTRAGLLMFGNFYDIKREFPNYFLDYQDHRNLVGDMRWSDRITSSSGEWSGNLYDFFYRICFKITEDIPTPFKMKGIFRDDNVPMKRAVREALCNTLSNADYHMELGVVIKQYHDKIIFSNPGALAIPKNIALLGGTSKARNKNILDIFSYINIGERGGTGIPLIMATTKEENYPSPILEDRFNPDETKLTIFIKNIVFDNGTLHLSSKNLTVEDGNLTIDDKNLTIEGAKVNLDNGVLTIQTNDDIIKNSNYKTDVKANLLKIENSFRNEEFFGRGDIAQFLNCSSGAAYNLLNYLLELDIIESVKGHGKSKYKFK